MSTAWAAVLIASAVAFTLKLSGYLVPARWLAQPRLAAALASLPAALLAALVMTETFADGKHLTVDARIVGLAVAAVALWRKAPFIVVVVLGAAAAAAVIASSAAAKGSCDRQCLLTLVDRTMNAIAAQDYRSLPWADPTRYTENNVGLMIGDAWWGSAGDKAGPKAFAFADPETGNVVWIGTIWDHDVPGFGMVRINAPDGKIREMEVIAGRTPWPVPFGDPTKFAIPARAPGM